MYCPDVYIKESPCGNFVSIDLEVHPIGIVATSTKGPPPLPWWRLDQKISEVRKRRHRSNRGRIMKQLRRLSNAYPLGSYEGLIKIFGEPR